VVDLTGNGGGSDWVDPAVRVLTPAKIESTVIGGVRHEHWDKMLENQVESLKSCLASHGELAGGVIAAAIARRQTEIQELRTPCEKTGLWQRSGVHPTCRQLVRVSPVLPYAKPGELDRVSCARDLFGPIRYRYHEGTNALPLVVLVDGRTGSAAEYFAEALQDHHAAMIIGAPTVGAGCGFTNGGIPTVLPRSGARVHVSDCARIRSDGSNAVAGVTPDVVLPLLDRDSPYQRARKVFAALEGAFRAAVAQKPALR
jgi:hypothetical protein